MSPHQDLLTVTAFFSVLVHAVVILGVGFKLPELATTENRDNTLDVVLINTSNQDIPDYTTTISTDNNQGGGQDDQEATSPLPYKAVDASQIESIKLTAEQQAKTTLAPDQLIAAQSATLATQKPKPQEARIEHKQRQIGSDIITTKSERQLERERLIARINVKMAEYQKRPIKEFISPTTTRHEAAKYLDDWRKKVEVLGNANYPAQAKTEALSGTLILTVEINRNGSIRSVIVNKPSQHKLLNDSAMQFVREASPFRRFPGEINPDIDVLVITRAFHFLSNNRLSSSDVLSQF